MSTQTLSERTKTWNNYSSIPPSWMYFCPRYSDIEGQPRSRVRINVSGLSFELWLADLNKHPNTLLGCPLLRRPYYDQMRNEYFFDRHRGAFEAIFYYYKYGGRLRKPTNVPMDIFMLEVEFYRLEYEVIQKFRHDQGLLLPSQIILPRREWQRKLWMLLEYPQTSGWAYFLGIVSVLFTVTSVVVYCTETVRGLKKTCTDSHQFNFLDIFFLTESVCNIWFSLEIIMRFIACPSKRRYLKSPQNIIDIAAIIPYYVALFKIVISIITNSPLILCSQPNSVVVSLHSTASNRTSITVNHDIASKIVSKTVATINNNEGTNSKGGGGSSLAILRAVRLVKIFNLTKHSSGLQVIVLAIRASLNGLCVFLGAVGISVLLFSSVLYHLEKENKTVTTDSHRITSIPAAFWWCITTMCTVGYGDLVPSTYLGKLVGSMCAVCGVLTVAMAVPIISENFNHFYILRTGRGRFYTTM